MEKINSLFRHHLIESESGRITASYLSISLTSLSLGLRGCEAWDAVLDACLAFFSQLPSFILFAEGSASQGCLQCLQCLAIGAELEPETLILHLLASP